MMNIVSAKYQSGLSGENVAVKIEFDNETVIAPLDPANRHYAAILEWVAEGNTIQEAD